MMLFHQCELAHLNSNLLGNLHLCFQQLPKQSTAEEPLVRTIIVYEEEEKHKDILVDEDGFEVVEGKMSRRSRKNTEKVYVEPDDKSRSDLTANPELPSVTSMTETDKSIFYENTERKQENADLSFTSCTLPVNLSQDSFWLDKSLYDEAE